MRYSIHKEKIFDVYTIKQLNFKKNYKLFTPSKPK